MLPIFLPLTISKSALGCFLSTPPPTKPWRLRMYRLLFFQTSTVLSNQPDFMCVPPYFKLQVYRHVLCGCHFYIDKKLIIFGADILTVGFHGLSSSFPECIMPNGRASFELIAFPSPACFIRTVCAFGYRL